jgi:signal transduction histidine kinase
MAANIARSRPRIRPSVSRRDLIPELGIAAGAVGITAVIHSLLVLRLGENALFLFAATAAGLTFWRGLGPGMLASSMGSTVGSSLSSLPFNELTRHRSNVPIETLLLFAGSMFTCWLIYRLRVDQEDTERVQERRNDALSFVSHELRQPLSSITLAADILERDPSPETRTQVTKLILRSAARLGSVIDDLNDVTRLRAGAIKVELKTVRLQEPIEAAIDATRPAIELKQQRLIVNLPDQPLWINGDSLRLEQVFGNLLSNACKYSPEGAEISIACRQQTDRAVVIVRDTGVGINRDMLEAIFDPFVRESNGGADGLGIGLTLARNLITQHGGRVSAESDGPGRGSTFMIELPVVAAPRLELQHTVSAATH